MALLRLIQAAKISLLSTTTGGRSIVADYFSCHWQLEVETHHGPDDASFGEQVFDISVTQVESEVEPETLPHEVLWVRRRK